MNGSEQEKRFYELAKRAASRGCCTNTEFLDQAQQGILLSLPGGSLASGFQLLGGYEHAERRLAIFGDEQQCGYGPRQLIACVEIRPLSGKFVGLPGHRDYLGALLNLGLRRSVLGDIVIGTEAAYVFCLSKLAEIICRELNRVGRNTVVCRQVAGLAAAVLPEPEETVLNVASLRLDALLASVWKLSRSESQQLIAAGRVWVNDRQTGVPSLQLKPEDKISVRGYGRFFFLGEDGQTRKGRSRVRLRIYK